MNLVSPLPYRPETESEKEKVTSFITKEKEQLRNVFMIRHEAEKAMDQYASFNCVLVPRENSMMGRRREAKMFDECVEKQKVRLNSSLSVLV